MTITLPVLVTGNIFHIFTSIQLMSHVLAMYPQTAPSAEYVLNWASLPPVVVMIAAFLLGGWVVGREKGSKISIIFSLFPITIGLWLFSRIMLYNVTVEPAALRWARWGFLGIPFMPATLYLFTTAILDRYERRRWLVWIVWGLAIGFAGFGSMTGAIVSGVEEYAWGYNPVDFGWLTVPFIIYFFSGMTGSLFEFWEAYRQATNEVDIKRIRALLLAVGVAWLGMVDFLPALGVEIYPLGCFFALGFLVLAARAIRRYHLEYSPAFAADQIVETIADPVLVCDQEGKLRYVNSAAAETFGYAPEELMGSRLSRLAAETTDEEHVEELVWREVNDREVLFRSDSGQPVPVSLSAARLTGPGDETAGLVVRAQDIRTAKEARRLQELDRLKSEFFANISHEFRTPLTLILSPIEEALEGTYGAISENLRQRLRQVRANGRRLLRLVEQLLDLSRRDAGQMILEARPGELILFLRERVQAFMPWADQQDIDLVFQAQVETCYVRFDQDKLEKVISNLLSNALKFTPEGGEVSVGAELCESGDERHVVELAVRDTGPGISKGQLGSIFDRFQRGDSRVTRTGEGAGIGLALVKELTECHGGTVSVDSEEGQGSTFTVRLPLARVTPAVVRHPSRGDSQVPEIGHSLWTDPEQVILEPGETEANRSAKSPPDDAPTVLIVEDNAEMRAYLRRRLQPCYRILEAKDGEEGLAVARQCRPACIVSDVMMPETGGFGLCEALTSEEELRQIPLILLTARAAEGDTLQGLAAGANDYLQKPFRIEELEARIESLLDLRRAIRQASSAAAKLSLLDVEARPADEQFLERVIEALEAHLDNSRFGVEDLAYEVGLSARQLRRKLKDIAGETPSAFMRRVRLERAARLLDRRSGSISQIAYNVGFRSPSHFSRVFKEKYDHSPSEYAARAGET